MTKKAIITNANRQLNSPQPPLTKRESRFQNKNFVSETTPSLFKRGLGRVNSQSAIRITSFILLTIFLPACFEPEEGCLDIEASNFQLAADRGCSKDASGSCFCTYPKVSLQIEQVFDKVAFSTNQAYRTSAGEYIRIQDIQFYISDIKLVLEDGQIATTLDTITLTLTENDQLVNKISLDDFHLIKPDARSINSLIISNLSGNFEQLQFSVGIKAPENTTSPDQINQSGHVLAIDSMYQEQEGYSFNRLLIQPDTSINETFLFQLTQADGLPRVVLDLSGVTKQPGKNISIQTLQINHAKWLDGINFAETNQEEIRRKIVTNTTNVFSILL